MIQHDITWPNDLKRWQSHQKNPESRDSGIVFGEKKEHQDLEFGRSTVSSFETDPLPCVQTWPPK